MRVQSSLPRDIAAAYVGLLQRHVSGGHRAYGLCPIYGKIALVTFICDSVLRRQR